MKKSRLQETSMEITVGAFMFMVLLALGFFTIVLSRENIFRRSYAWDVLFDDVRGLREGDSVYIRGVVAGKIRALQVRRDGVLVRMVLREEVKLYEDYKVEILTASAFGGRYLNVTAGSEEKDRVPPGTTLKGLPPVDFIEEASATVQSIKRTLEEGKVLENLKVAVAQLRGIVTKLNEGEGALGQLLAQRQVYEDLQQIVANLRKISESLAEGKSSLGRLLSSEDTLYQDLTDAVAALKQIAGGVQEGRGSIGRLVKDEEIYEEIRLLIQEARATLDDFREVTPLTTFTSVFLGVF